MVTKRSLALSAAASEISPTAWFDRCSRTKMKMTRPEPSLAFLIERSEKIPVAETVVIHSRSCR
jgi:hypothetical protein